MTETAQEITNLHLSLEQLQNWQALGYGMFISFGMSTFLAEEHPSGDHPSSVYAPDQHDVDQLHMLHEVGHHADVDQWMF